MIQFVQQVSQRRIIIGFFFSALLVVLVGGIGIFSSVRISQSFETLEKDVVGGITILEEVRSSFSLMLLETTTFLVVSPSAGEETEKQVANIMAYKRDFDEGITEYNKFNNRFSESGLINENDKREIFSIVESIIEKKQLGYTIEELLPLKKRARALEREKIFPAIQTNVDAAKERLALERAQNRSTVQTALILIVLSGFLGLAIIILLGIFIARKERRVMQFRENLISVVSHQLKTPITVIRGHAEFLLDSDISSEDKKDIKIIDDTAKDMNELVRALLDVSHIDQGEFTLEKTRVDVYVLIRAIIESQKSFAKVNNIHVKFVRPQGTVLVLGDKLRIQQALQNIINNGIKYNKKGGNLTITLAKEGRHVQVTVKDEGIGILRSDQGMIFKRFFRTKNAKERAHFGTGLGLLIAKEIIEQSGGKVWFQSKENKGTTFFIQLPLV